MAVCALDSCRRVVKPPTGSTKPPHVVKDAQGRVVKVFHNKCWMIEKRKARKGGGYVDGKYHEWAPTPYEMSQGRGRKSADDLVTPEQEAALEVRQGEIQEQSAMEPRPEGWSDWREPQTLSLEDLEAAIGGEAEEEEDGTESTTSRA